MLVQEPETPERRASDQRWLLIAGAGLVAVLALLAYAVLHTARTPGRDAPVKLPAATPVTTTHATTPTSTSYVLPNPQTSAATGPPPPGAPPTEAPSAEQPADTHAPETSAPPTQTTIYNPYVTTSPPNAGAI